MTRHSIREEVTKTMGLLLILAVGALVELSRYFGG